MLASGVRGIDAYGATWPPFLDRQRHGAVFEIVELDVTAGDNVGFARPASLHAYRPGEGRGQPPSTLHRPAQGAAGRHPRAPLVPVAVSSRAE